MTERHYAPRFSKRATLGALAAVTIGVFSLGMAVPYAVGEDPAETVTSSRSSTETTVRRRQPVPVAQIVETTTTSTTSR